MHAVSHEEASGLQVAQEESEIDSAEQKEVDGEEKGESGVVTDDSSSSSSSSNGSNDQPSSDIQQEQQQAESQPSPPIESTLPDSKTSVVMEPIRDGQDQISVDDKNNNDDDDDDDDNGDDMDDEFDQIMKEMTPTGSRPLSMSARKSARMQQEKRKSDMSSSATASASSYTRGADSFQDVPLDNDKAAKKSAAVKEQQTRVENVKVDDEEDPEKPLSLMQKVHRLVTTPSVAISATAMTVLFCALAIVLGGIIITLITLHGSNIMFACGGIEFTAMVVLSALTAVGMLPVFLFLFSKIQQGFSEIFAEEDDSVPKDDDDEPSKLRFIASVVQRTFISLGQVVLVLVGIVALCLLIALFIFTITVREMYVSPLSGEITVSKATTTSGKTTLSSMQLNPSEITAAAATAAVAAADAGPSLTKPAKVYREWNGIVHIVAESDLDMFYAQGFATAQDRLWQLDFNRRLAQGAVSEILGEAWLPWDKLRRTIGLARAASETYDALPADTKAILQAYCNGINAFIDYDRSDSTNSKNRIPELIVFTDYEFQKWKPQDLVLLHKEMAFSMSRNMDSEIRRLIALGRDVTIERIDELMPDYPAHMPTILSRADAGIPDSLTDEEIEAIYGEQYNDTHAYIPPTMEGSSIVGSSTAEEMIAKIDSRVVDMMLFRSSNFPPNSNAWAVGGKYTESGKPILANDPHFALEAPSTWHMVHLKSDATNAIGLAIPGIPGIFIGRNEHIAWGFSNLVADTMDLYATSVTADKTQYYYEGTARDFTTRVEKIKVLIGNEKVEEVSHTVKETLFGPVVNDVINDISGLDIRPLSLKWTGFDAAQDTSLVALTSHFKSKSWSEFSSTMSKLATPALSVVYADKKDIAYTAAGNIPLRDQGHSGRFVVDADDATHHTNIVPADDMPKKLNPSKGYIIAANQMPVPRGYAHRISNDVSPHFRAKRIEEMLLSRMKATSNKLTRHDMALIQRDVNSTLFHTFKYVFERIDPNELKNEQQRNYRDMMVNWDGEMKVGSIEATFFEKWFMEMDVTSSAEIGPFHPSAAYFLLHMLRNETVHGTDSACLKWGTCQEAAKAVFNETVAFMTEQGDPRWGKDVHHAEYTHAALEDKWCRCLGLRASYVTGGTETVNFAPITNTRNFASLFGPSARMIVEMLPFDELAMDKSPDMFTTAVGQSGNLFESSYSNMMVAFHAGEYQQMALNFDGPQEARFAQELVPAS